MHDHHVSHVYIVTIESTKHNFADFASELTDAAGLASNPFPSIFPFGSSYGAKDRLLVGGFVYKTYNYPIESLPGPRCA